jgi:hypothetical protein
MKIKTVKKVIADLKELFELDETRDSHEFKGTFLIYKYHFKRKKVSKMLDEYFSNVKIEDGTFVKLKKSLVYSRFKIVSNEVIGKKEKEKEEKGTKKRKGKKSKKSN